MVKGRIVAPPTGPFVVPPGSANRSEHVAAHNGGSHVGIATLEETVIKPFASAFFANHSSPAASGEDPLVERAAADAQWIFECLIGPGSAAVERYREITHQQFRHRALFRFW